MSTTATTTPVEITREMSANEFLSLFLDTVAAEAVFTDENNESRTLGDYLADLSMLCGRIIAGERPIIDPLDAANRPIDRWVRGDAVARAAVELIGPAADRPNVDSEYVRGAWEVALEAIGALDDCAREDDGSIGGRATADALCAYTPVLTGRQK